MIDWLWEPWTFEFMRRALWAGLLVAVTGSVVGAFVVVRGLAFLSDAVAHSSLAGAAVAFLLGGGNVAISLGAVGAAAATALGVAQLTRRGRVHEDTAIALLFAGLFGVAILLISRARNYAVELNAFIVGNILGVTTGELLLMAALTVVVLGAVFLFYRELLYSSYDPESAAALGVPVAAAQTGLLLLVALAAVIAFRLVGVVLVMAMLVAPAAAAMHVARTLPTIMALGTLLASLATVAGLYASFYANLAAGPAIVVATIAMYALLWALRGSLTRAGRRDRRPRPPRRKT